MNPPNSSSSPLIGPRARLFSFVSVKKRWEAADQEAATKTKQIELDITLPKGRERQKTVVFYLNQENGLKLQEVVEESKLPTGTPPPVKKESESAEEPQGRKRSPIVRQSDRHSTFELIERASRIQDDLPQEASPPPKLEGSAISSAPTIITTSAPMTPPPPSKVSPYEPHHEEPAGEGDEGHEHEEGEKVEEREESDADEVEGAKKAERETEYSSEEEVEEEGYLVVRPRRSQTVQRQQVDMPESKEGWGKKCGVEGYRKKTWQRRYFVLQYPFLDIYDKKGGKSKGRISMRGGILVDEELLDDDKKYKKNAKTSLKISADSKHKLILQFKNDKEKKAWARALWSNIYYANPAKQSGGVSYKVIQATIILPLRY